MQTPIPAIKKLPKWYKEKKPFTHGSKFKYEASGTTNVSVKWCNPFGDSLGAGYFVLLEVDLQITKTESGHELVWGSGGDSVITTHSPAQISPELIPIGYSSQPYKFENFWVIKTPKGYSTLFTHPLNRFSNEWLTLSGVVETDTYDLPVNFPFLLNSTFEGIIEAGTPIAQLIPFKRVSWYSSRAEFSQKRTALAIHNFKKTIFRGYKRFHWQRKEWK